MDQARTETRTDLAVKKYRVTGKGVTVVVIDRGIDWRHPDFVNPDGTTRIRALLDMTGGNGCQDSRNPAPVEYTQAQINAGLAGRYEVRERDAVGHGTATAGVAVGNGRASNGRWAGIAPEADLLIVKAVSEGAPAHDGVPEEPAFLACMEEALDWVDRKITELGQPAVAIINSGTQWGPIDGTSAVSRKLDAVFGLGRPGRIYVAPTGDEGGLDSHAGGTFSQVGTTVNLKKSSDVTSFISLWYSGGQPAQITLGFADGATSGAVGPGRSTDGTGIRVIQYAPGVEAYPWQSTSGDRAVWIRIDGHRGDATLRLQATGPGTGHFDLFGDLLGPYFTSVVTFGDHLVPGRLTDYASTRCAVTVADHVDRDTYTDINGARHDLSAEGSAGQLWNRSSGGPTRDGRAAVDVSAPGQNTFAPLANQSYWATFPFNVPLGGSRYTRFGGTSGSAPIVVGAVALMLQMRPNLTAAEVKSVLHATAVRDKFTGQTPNPEWGYGKLDVLGALDAIAP